ncbi:MAG: T9SS type A sorting domain-containing protein [Bacteroidia bacterium]|nr:T9SS type A sorting domain-containing protein [Bacteroidia bacterium]MDW8301261.1 T9SS type A sorting domain-containing protein [Bacteroidia bacterium]
MFLGIFSYQTGFSQAMTTPCTGLDCSSNGITALEYPVTGSPKINWTGTCPTSGYQSINQTAKIVPGSPQTFKITVTDPSRLGVWVDWNDNGNFEASENIYLSTAPHLSSGVNNIVINVPTASAIPGPHALRVIVVNFGYSAFNASSALTSNCATLVGGAVFGHIQDYKATVDGVDMKLDQILGLPLTNIFSSAGSYPISMKLDNVGVYPIDTCYVTWQLSPGSVNKPYNPGVYTAMMCPTCPAGGTMINPGANYIFAHPQPLIINNLGRDTLCAWVKSVHNGNTVAYQDKFPSNDTLCNKQLVFPKRDMKAEALVEPVQCPTSLFANVEYPVKMTVKNMGDLALTSSNNDSMRIGYFVKLGSTLVDYADTVIKITSLPSGSTFTYKFSAPSSAPIPSTLVLPTNGVYDMWIYVKLFGLEHDGTNDTLGPICLRADLKNCKADSVRIETAPFIVGGNYKPRIYIKNVGTKDAINPVLGYRVNNGTPVTSVYPGLIPPGGTANHLFAIPFTPTTTGTYTIKAWVKMYDDLDPSNDTATTTITIGAPIIDIRPESVASPAYIKAGQPTTLSVWVENLGSNVMTDYTIEVREQFATTPISVDIVNGTVVLPGTKILHNFTGTFTPTKDTMVLCFKTMNPNNQVDGNTSNDVLCRTFTPEPVAPSNVRDNVIPDISNVEIFPNPNGGQFSMQFNSAKRQDIAIEVYNLQGQKVHGFTNTYLPGAYVLPMDLTHLPKGIYYCRILSSNQLITKKVVIY